MSDDVGVVHPERLAVFMSRQLSGMPDSLRKEHLARLKEEMPAVHAMVCVSMKTDNEEPESEPPPKKSGKAFAAVTALRELILVLRGGGVWATIAVLLIVCLWLSYELKVAHGRIVEILLAANESRTRTSEPLPTSSSRAREVITRYTDMYQQQLTDTNN